MRHLITIGALAFGCGSAQHVVGPSQQAEALVSSPFPAPHPGQKRVDQQGKCYRPQEWPESVEVIARNGACWAELDATEAECKDAAKTNPWHVWAEGKCWYFLPGNSERIPTSSVPEPSPRWGSVRAMLPGEVEQRL